MEEIGKEGVLTFTASAEKWKTGRGGWECVFVYEGREGR